VDIGKNVLVQTNAIVPSGAIFKAQKNPPSPSLCSAP
jgi:hypothetical protein